MIRRIEPQDINATAKVWHRSGLDEYDYLPDFQKMTESEATTIFQMIILKENEVWVYDIDAEIQGFIALKGSYIDRLYVDPERQRHGIGTALLNFAKRLSPNGLSLSTHQQNHRACRFYEAHGFVAVKFGKSPPPESVPDVEYQWYG